jgi:hypothetical protein
MSIMLSLQSINHFLFVTCHYQRWKIGNKAAIGTFEGHGYWYQGDEGAIDDSTFPCGCSDHLSSHVACGWQVVVLMSDIDNVFVWAASCMYIG